MTTNSQDNNVQVFYADKQPRRYSLGRVFVVLVSLALTAFLVGVILINSTGLATGIGVALLVSPGFAVLLYEIVSQLMILHFLPRMRYELRDGGLSLVLGGPWKSRIRNSEHWCPGSHVCQRRHHQHVFHASLQKRHPDQNQDGDEVRNLTHRSGWLSQGAGADSGQEENDMLTALVSGFQSTTLFQNSCWRVL